MPIPCSFSPPLAPSHHTCSYSITIYFSHPFLPLPTIPIFYPSRTSHPFSSYSFCITFYLVWPHPHPYFPIQSPFPSSLFSPPSHLISRSKLSSPPPSHHPPPPCNPLTAGHRTSMYSRHTGHGAYTRYTRIYTVLQEYTIWILYNLNLHWPYYILPVGAKITIILLSSALQPSFSSHPVAQLLEHCSYDVRARSHCQRDSSVPPSLSPPAIR